MSGESRLREELRDEVRDELLRLELALATRDPAAVPVGRIAGGLASLIADDFLEFGASGATWSAADVRAVLAEPPRPVTIADFEVAELSPDVVLATYRSTDPRSANRASIWVRREGGWQMRFHQGTLTG